MRRVAIVCCAVLLSMAAIAPILGSVREVYPGSYADFSFVDVHYHITRVELLARFGAPLKVWPDMAGKLPDFYPDFGLLWFATGARWTGLGGDVVYRIYGPLAAVALGVVVLYAFGRRVFGSHRSGMVAAVMGWLLAVPNPWDANPLLRGGVLESAAGALIKLHFIEESTSVSYGLAWMALTTVGLLLCARKDGRTLRSEIGLLILGALTVSLVLRVRPQIYLPIAPAYGLLLLYFLFRERRSAYLLPGISLAVFSAAALVEVAAPYYFRGSATLELQYGAVLPYLLQYSIPTSAAAFIRSLPWVLQPPLAGILAVAYSYSSLLITCLLICYAWRRFRPPGLDRVVVWYLVGTVVLAIVLSIILVNPGYSGGEAPGLEILFTIYRPLLLLAAGTLAMLAGFAIQKLALPPQTVPWLSLASMLVLAGVARSAAETAVAMRGPRAFTYSAEEKDAYRWIRAETPPLSVVAADPDRSWNVKGEAMRTHNFLRAATMRPVYVQRVAEWDGEVPKRRMEAIRRIFDASDSARVDDAVAACGFDYLLVYADSPLKAGPGKNLELVRPGEPAIYARRGD